MATEVKGLKMVSGEEVICKVRSTTEGLMVSDALVLQVMPDGRGGYGLGLLPWVHSTKRGEIRINEDQIMGVIDSPDKEVQDAYLSQTSGIQLAPAGSVLHG